MAVSFRLAKADQLCDIRALYIKSMSPIGDRMGIETGSDAFSNLQAFLDARNLYVLEDNGVLMGALAMHEIDNGLYVDYLAIAADQQGQGHGTRLLSEAELIAESRELPYLRLHTPEVMHELVSYYQSHGFSETHRSLPSHGRDAILRVHFQKDIARSDQLIDTELEHDRVLV